MSSSVHFRFKSAREFETLSFEGDFLKVADLKIAIVERKKLNFGEGFDLEISDASTGDVFNDESALVQKNTSVIVRRIPGLKQGGILSHQEMAVKNERYAEKQSFKPQQAAGTASDQNPVLPKTIEGSDEAERIASLVMQSNVQYDQFPRPMRGRYANRSNNRAHGGSFGATRHTHGQSPFPSASHPSSSYPDRAPRPSSNYVCHRCNRPGHWIDQCPTNGDPTYDRIKVRAPTGIPRSMLRQVDAPESGTGLQDSSGHFVTLQPNEEEFARQTVGLRLSQAAASGVEREVDSNTGLKDGGNITKAYENGTSSTEPHPASLDDVRENDKAKTTDVPEEVLDKTEKDTVEQGVEGAKEGAIDPPERDSGESSHELGSEPDSCKVTAKQPDESRHTSRAKNSPITSGRRQAQPPPRPGVPHVPVSAMPPGFPPLGMPPIPPGMPPIPPHILMAMAMTNRQNGRHPQLPPGLHPNIPMPFPTSTPSNMGEQKQDIVAETQKDTSEERRLNSDSASPGDVHEQEVNKDRKSSPTVALSRQISGKEGIAHDDERADQQGVDHQPSEMIDSTFNSKSDSHPSRALHTDRGDTRTLKQRSFYENEDVSRREYRASREPEPAAKPYTRKEVIYRSRSPSSRRVRSSSGESSPGRRKGGERTEEVYTSLSPRRGTPEMGRKERYMRSSNREERNMRYRSYESKEDFWQDDIIGDARRGFYSRRSQSPLAQGRRGTNGTMSPDISVRYGRSAERHSRFSSPQRRFHGDSVRGRRGNESPDRRFRRDSSTDRQFRSITPPRSSKYTSRLGADQYIRKQRLRSPSAEKGRDSKYRRGPGENRRHYEPAGRAGSKILGPESYEVDPRSAPEDLRQYPTEGLKGTQNVSERSAQDNADERRTLHSMTRSSRRKREFDGRSVSEERELKRPRGERSEDRKYVYHHQEIRDRPSVHDRLGRPVERRRRKGQRRSVHDRLG